MVLKQYWVSNLYDLKVRGPFTRVSTRTHKSGRLPEPLSLLGKEN
jgi:hypothetical protein